MSPLETKRVDVHRALLFDYMLDIDRSSVSIPSNNSCRKYVDNAESTNKPPLEVECLSILHMQTLGELGRSRSQNAP